MIFVNETNDSAKGAQKQVQAIISRIEEQVSKLPQTLEETVKAYGAITRRRMIKSATDLMLALFIYASPGMSQRLLAACSAVIGIADISDQAWQKKIIKCERWLSHVLTETMYKLPDKSKRAFRGRSVKLLDGTIIQQAGTKGKRGGELVRAHMCYNLTEGCMDSIILSDNSVAESVTVFTIEPGVLYIADAGYGKGKNIAHIISCQADALFRVTPNHLSLAEDQKGKIKIDMAKKLNTHADIIDFICYVHSENRKYVPVRIVASRLPEDKALLAKERKIRSALKRQTKNIREQTLVYAEWVILITTLSDGCSAGDLLKMYRSRWQIELLFKRIKQSFNVSQLPCASLTHSKVITMLWLILWSLTERNALAMEAFLLERNMDMSLYTPWPMHSFLFHQLLVLINCLWALCFDPDDHSLAVFRRLRSHRSARVCLYSALRFN